VRWIDRLSLSVRGMTVVAVLALSVALSAGVGTGTARAAGPAWTTYDHDVQRSAIDPDSTSPLPPTPAWTSAPLDGPVYGQPLVLGSRVYVATENDTLYALDATTGTVVWSHHVGTPVPAGDLPCGDISPTVGITGTPVIDPAGGRIYAVADTLQGATVRHELVALQTSTGAAVAGFPIAIDPPGSDPKALLQRTALALDDGRVFAGFGGNNGDCSDYHGWVMGAGESGSGTPSAFEVDSGAAEHGGAIWGSGDGPPVDAAGRLLYSTGNGFGSTSADLQESVVALDPANLALDDHWTASNWQMLDDDDLDLGSSEPLPLPGALLFEIGKDGVGRLLSEGSLGSVGQVFSAQACDGGGAFGASLYDAGIIYVPCAGGLEALKLTTGSSPSFTAVPGWSAPSGASGPPIFAGGLVWSTGWRGSNLLYGVDPATGAVRYTRSLDTFEHFATPSAAGGRLFVAAGSTIAALTIASYTPPAPPVGSPPVGGPPPGPRPPATGPRHRRGPRLSAVRLGSRHVRERRGTTLRLTVSEQASVRIGIQRVRAGRRIHGHCRPDARHGRRCTFGHLARRLRFRAHAGNDRRRLRHCWRRLPAGRYRLTVVAVGTGGRRSRTIAVGLRLTR
jgi:outer membrane protein assembly factor BamB